MVRRRNRVIVDPVFEEDAQHFPSGVRSSRIGEGPRRAGWGSISDNLPSLDEVFKLRDPDFRHGGSWGTGLSEEKTALLTNKWEGSEPGERIVSLLWISTISHHERSNYYCRVEEDE